MTARLSGRRGSRDRRGRGLRGPLAPAGVPAVLTRAEQFDEHVHAALSRLGGTWADQLAAIDVVVADVADDAGQVLLGRAVPARGAQPPRLVIHRRSIEARARGAREREALVHRVVVEALAELLGLDPSLVDPDSGDPD